MQDTASAKKPVIFSGIQPTGTPTLGNYIGAMRNWKMLESDFRCLYCVVDLHALTVRQDPAELRRRSRELIALLVAVGLNPEETILFIQSHVSGHAELAWILNCFTYMGELGRMTQFKDKSAKHADNINAGLFTYPVLMAADILLYQTNLVPVGADQKQHLEISRDIAERFNGVHEGVFTLPEPYIDKNESGGRVMSLQEPTRKMSKSDAEDSFISMLDRADVINRKIKRAVTDSDGEIRFDAQEKPGVSNLLTILSTLTGRSLDETVASLSDQGYGALKQAVTDAVVATLTPIQQRFDEIMADKTYLDGVIASGAQRATAMSVRTLEKVYKKLGLVAKPR